MSMTLARRSASSRSGGRSIGPATRSASASSATVPPLTTKVRAEPPSSTSRNAAPKATSATGLARSAAKIDVDDLAHVAGEQFVHVGVEQQRDQKDAADDRHREQQLEGRFGDELTMTSGQLAAAISAPRFRAAFSPGVCGIGQQYSVYLCGILLLRVVATVDRNDG